MPDARRYFDLPSPFAFKRGGALTGATLAYETWGTLDAKRGNAIFILTGLSPSAHAASNADDPSPGWWEGMIGPGKYIDTNRWFVICANTLGSCKGSTGPASMNPATGELYRLDFPALTLEDVANASFALVRGLGIEKLACLIGNSMGGMSGLAYLVQHPGSTRSHISISTAPQAQPFAIAIRSLQREAIRLDPNWKLGHYDDEHYPEAGMSIARKLGVITYRSAMEWVGRFARIRLDSRRARGRSVRGRVPDRVVPRRPRAPLRAELRSEQLSLPLARERLVRHRRIRASGRRSRRRSRRIRLERACVIGVSTDILFPLTQQQQIADGLRAGGAEVDFVRARQPAGPRFVPRRHSALRRAHRTALASL